MDVQFFSRKVNHLFFSIEELFITLQESLKPYLTCNNNTMPFKSIGIINRWRNGRFAKKYKGQINHITGDVHYLALFLPSKNTVLTIHDCGELDKQKGIKKLVLWLFWFYLPVKKLKYITVISEATKAHLLQYVRTNPSKILVIPNCLIGNYVTDYKPFDTSKPTILQVGITSNKNIERVAEALQGISCSLTIIGKPSPSQVSVLHSYGIHFQYKNELSRNEVIAEYAKSDLLIFVSLIEGFGLPIIEAQASGKPVITSNISAMPSTAGSGACLVDPYSVVEIRKGILKVIQDNTYRQQIIDAGQENCKRFTPSNIANQYLQLYKRIVSENQEGLQS